LESNPAPKQAARAEVLPILKAAEPATRKRISSVLSNTDIAELLAEQSERETGIHSRAFRRTARNAFLWPVEASDLVAQNRSLSELRGIGPLIETQIRQWIEKPRRVKTVPAVRRDFLSLAEARRVLAARPAWTKELRGDLQMHTRWSDGSGAVAEMADAAANRNYEYIAITDHSKTLKIVGGIDELALKRQGVQIAKINATLSKSIAHVTVLRSIEMNLNPRGEGDMGPGLAAIFGSCSRLLPLGSTYYRRSNRALSRSIVQSTRSHPRPPAR
jgi:PHP domain